MSRRGVEPFSDDVFMFFLWVSCGFCMVFHAFSMGFAVCSVPSLPKTQPKEYKELSAFGFELGRPAWT